MKTVVITGTSSGVGLNLTKIFLAHNFQVVATLRQLNKRSHLFENFSNRQLLHLFELDITNQNQRHELKIFLEKISPHGIHILINNAGVGFYGAAFELSPQQLRQQMEVNFFAPCLLTQELRPLLEPSAKVINIGSIMSRFTLPLASAYASSKYAFLAWSQAQYIEASQLGIHFCYVQPGSIATDFATSSMNWASNTPLKSPFYKGTEYFKKLISQAQPHSLTAHDVAIKVYKLCQKTILPAHYIIGRDAQAIRFLLKLLPLNLFYRLLRIFYRWKIF